MDTFVFTASGSRAAFVESSMLLYSRTRKFVGVGHLTRPPGAAAAPQSRREGAGHLAWSRPAVRARSAAPGRGRGWRRPRHPPHTRAAPREPTRKRRLRLSTISLFNRILHISCGGLLPGEGRGAGWGSTAVPPPQPDPLQTGPAPSAEPHRGWPRGGGRWLGSAGRHRGARRAGQGPGLRASVVSSPHPRRRDAPPTAGGTRGSRYLPQPPPAPLQGRRHLLVLPADHRQRPQLPARIPRQLRAGAAQAGAGRSAPRSPPPARRALGARSSVPPLLRREGGMEGRGWSSATATLPAPAAPTRLSAGPTLPPAASGGHRRRTAGATRHRAVTSPRRGRDRGRCRGGSSGGGFEPSRGGVGSHVLSVGWQRACGPLGALEGSRCGTPGALGRARPAPGQPCPEIVRRLSSARQRRPDSGGVREP